MIVRTLILAASITVAGIGHAGVTRADWDKLIADASAVLVDRGAPALVNAGFVESPAEGVTTDFAQLHALAAAHGVRAQVVFVAAGRQSSPLFSEIACWIPNANGCAVAEKQSGYLLYLPRHGQVVTLLHELGHLFGLGHDARRESVMYSHSAPGGRLTRGYIEAMRRFTQARE